MRLLWGLWLLSGCLLAAAPAISGAWLREAGEGFAALEGTARAAGSSEGALYLEYGIGPRLTLGLDAMARGDGTAHALGFARLPLFATGAGARLAVELAAGGHRYRRANDAMARALLQYGRGMRGGGWVGLEAGVEHRRGLGAPLLKLDVVAGLPTRGNLQAMVKLETFYKDGYGPGATLTPSLIYRDGKGRRWVSGIKLRRAGTDRSAGVTFGVWREF